MKQPKREVSEEEIREELEQIGRKKVLVVDDDPAVHLLFEKQLRGSGVSLISEVNPGLAVSDFLRFKPDVVFIDVHMPQLRGSTVLKMLMDVNFFGSHLVVMSADRRAARFLEQSSARRGVEFMEKPISRGTLANYLYDHDDESLAS